MPMMRSIRTAAAATFCLALGLGAAGAEGAADFYKGKPHIVVQNMPGAGGIRAMTFLQNVAPKDGSTIGLVHSSVPFAPLYGIKGAHFDPRQVNWIGSINAATGICVSWTASGITKWQDLFDKSYIVGGTGAGSQMETMPAMLNKLFGT